MMTDIEIAQKTNLRHISEVAEKAGFFLDEVEFYGDHKAKIKEKAFKRLEDKKNGKLILVTAVNPTPAGEGKTTITIGLDQAMQKLGKNAVIALREPSMGPVFGVKGGATGGGYSQVLPMEDINLHFTGDMHAITSANNLLCAVLDNHVHHGNELGIDPRQILIKRCLDMNDRELRNVVAGLGGKINGMPREDSFIITVATEVMAILCLSRDIEDLKTRLGNILVAYKFSGEAVFARDLKVQGAMAALLKDAIKPNLVQTLEAGPVIMHGGPFANIAHGCNSIRATKLALKLGDYCITEAGFGSDLGAEKFLDIKCRVADLNPDCIVLVATIRALKYNGGSAVADLKAENLDYLKKGIINLEAHIENMRKFGVPVVVALNKFETDTNAEINFVKNFCTEKNCDFAPAEIFAKGGEGGLHLAEKVCEACEKSNNFKFIYDENLSIKEKILKIANEIYGASVVNYAPAAEKSIKNIEALNRANLPICIAKTQYSLSDNPKSLGRPKDFSITIRNITLSNGAGFIVAFAGDILAMPGLPKIPSAESIDVANDGIISGIF